jgi:SAM-dependent methyltransferase
VSGGYGSNGLVEALGRKSPLLMRLMKALYPPMPTLNIMEKGRIEAIQGRLFRSGATVINVGSGGLTGCGYRLWGSGLIRSTNVHHMDILAGDSVSLVGDAHRLPFQDNSIDSLIYQAVLEHVQDPRRVIDEATRVLKPGGYLYLEVPFLQGFHADPHDYQRYTLEGLRIRTKALTEIDAGVSVGPFCALVWIIRDGVSSCFSNRFLYAASRFVAGWALSPLRYFDYLIKNNPAAKRLACEYYMLCQKAKS